MKYCLRFSGHYTVDDWKYQFTISSDGYPHSKLLSDAIDNNLQFGYFEDTGSFLIITARGTDEFNKFKRLPSNKVREKFIDAACSTSMLIPYKETKNALLNDPNLLKALKERHNPDWVSFNNDKLKEITTALGAPTDELIIPAVSWIEFLLKSNSLGVENV
jgi:hypothetical protein